MAVEQSDIGLNRAAVASRRSAPAGSAAMADSTRPAPDEADATGFTLPFLPDERWRRNPWRVFTRWFASRMPKGLYGRSLIIIIAPMVLLQSVIAFVFMERHWQLVTQRLSRAVTADIAAVIDVIETYPQKEDFADIVRIARDRLSLSVSVLPPDPFPPATSKPFFSILDDVLREEIARQIGRPFWIDTVGNSDLLEIRIRLEKPEAVLRVFAKRSSAYASNSHIFLVWMVGTSLVLLIIAIMFLRNQIRPIQQLADAAERFGKGREMSTDFRIRGAREVRQAGLAFLQMRERIERQIQQRTAMLTGVSHDLRTILTRFKLQLALVGDSPEIEELQADVDEMQRMLQGYLDFARGEGGEQVEAVDIFELLKRHESEAAVKHRTIDIRCPEGFIMRVRRGAMARLIANLVSNAFRHAETLVVRVTAGNGWATLTFDDDGPGIPPDQREEVFRPFMRLDEARNQDAGGTGLGLSIARDIARYHGGDINLHESPMGGLRAVVRMPL
ncbi:MAG: two-component sensor histidine kinase [Alphaproteobacteria bacterium]|nr:MAG: two-component sensor histidine kinase [Alphaproteobacteria bacterium]